MDISAEPSRMLNNLRSSYFRSKNYRKATQALDPSVEAFPANAEYYKARGVARLQLREFRAAKADLEKYLKCSPEAEDDKAEVTRQLEAIIAGWAIKLKAGSPRDPGLASPDGLNYLAVIFRFEK